MRLVKKEAEQTSTGGSSLTRNSINFTETCPLVYHLLTDSTVETVVLKVSTRDILIFTQRSGKPLIAFAVHHFVRTSVLGSKVNLVGSTHGLDGSFTIAANTILTALQVTFNVVAKLTMFATSATLTLARINVKVVLAITAHAIIDAEMVAVGIRLVAIVARFHQNVARRSDVHGHGVFVERRVAITNKLIIAKLIHALNALSAIAIIVKKKQEKGKGWV